jgi:hypothetical protein
LAASSANCRRLGTFRNIAATWRALSKTAAGTRSLTRLATQFAAFYLATVGTKLNARGHGCSGFAACCLALLAAIGVQNHSNRSHRQHNRQKFLVHFHNQLLSKNHSFFLPKPYSDLS